MYVTRDDQCTVETQSNKEKSEIEKNRNVRKKEKRKHREPRGRSVRSERREKEPREAIRPKLNIQVARGELRVDKAHKKRGHT